MFPERQLNSSLELPVNLNYLRKHTTWIPNALHYSQDDSTKDVTKLILQFVLDNTFNYLRIFAYVRTTRIELFSLLHSYANYKFYLNEY